MKFLYKAFFFLLFTLILIEIFIIVPRKMKSKDESNEESQEISQNVFKNNNIGHVMKGVHLIESDKEKKAWELWADQAEGFKGGKGAWKLYNIRLNFYENQKKILSILGKSGQLDTTTKNMFIKGNIKVFSQNGYIFYVNQLNYLASSRMLESKDKVIMKKMQKKEQIWYLKGIGIKIFLDNNKIYILNDVFSQRKIKQQQNQAKSNERLELDEGKNHITESSQKNKVVKIRSERAEFNNLYYYAYFKGNVIIDYDSFRATGEEAKFKYDKKEKRMESLMIKNNIRLNDVDKLAIAEEMKVDFINNRCFLRGNPKLIQNNDELTGKEIIFLEGGKKVKIIGVKARVESWKMEESN